MTKKEYDAEYYKKNKKKIKLRSKLYKTKHRKKYIAYSKVYYKKRKKKMLKQNRNRHLKREYGINLEEYTSLLSRQKGKCAICKIKKLPKYQKNLHVDHCHKSKRIRGLLCYKCNSAIGLFKDSIPVIKSAIKYLEMKFK